MPEISEFQKSTEKGPGVANEIALTHRTSAILSQMALDFHSQNLDSESHLLPHLVDSSY